MQKNNANYNLIFSLDAYPILKKCIKEKLLVGPVEEEDEVCKRMNRGIINVSDSFDLIGNLYCQNAF